jgi:hypothetical protein
MALNIVNPDNFQEWVIIRSLLLTRIIFIYWNMKEWFVIELVGHKIELKIQC